MTSVESPGGDLGVRDVRPIRTSLSVPGDRLDLVEQAASRGSDGVWIDLEEPRTPFPESDRVWVRRQVGEFLEGLGTRPDRPIYNVRVQSIESGQMLKDLEAVAFPALTTVILPKVEGPADIYAADAILAAVENDRALERGSLKLWPIMETAGSLRSAYEIAMASPRVAYMGGAVSRFGDIVQALGYRWTPTGRETLMFRSKTLIDVRAAGLPYPVTGNWGGATDDVEGCRRWAEHGRDLGYRGTMTSQPAHVAMLNEVFSPRPEDIAYWQDLVRLADEAEASGSGPIIYGDANQGEGHVVHIAHVGSARQNLRWARDLGLA